LSIWKLGTASRAAAGIERSPLPREGKARLPGIGGADGNERTTPMEGGADATDVEGIVTATPWPVGTLGRVREGIVTASWPVAHGYAWAGKQVAGEKKTAWGVWRTGT